MENSEKTERIKVLVKVLNEASKAYYAEGRELMPNIEYDALYDELTALERETGIRLADSPTGRVGYEVVSELPKEAHASPMLSLDKTKSVEDLVLHIVQLVSGPVSVEVISENSKSPQCFKFSENTLAKYRAPSVAKLRKNERRRTQRASSEVF